MLQAVRPNRDFVKYKLPVRYDSEGRPIERRKRGGGKQKQILKRTEQVTRELATRVSHCVEITADQFEMISESVEALIERHNDNLIEHLVTRLMVTARASRANGDRFTIPASQARLTMMLKEMVSSWGDTEG